MNHVVALDSGWTLWRWACLRATGFPARLVLELAGVELAAAADRLLELEAEAARRRTELIAECKAAFARLEPDARRTVQRAQKRLWQHRVPDAIDDPTAEAARVALHDAVARRDAAEHELADHYARAQRAASTELRRIAMEDRFRQALLWQNRSGVHTGVDWLLRQPVEATDAETRKNERLVASYLQRYCTKNDTIGFFGPVGWARFVDDPAAIAQQPGTALVASRTIYYEYWAVDALAQRLAGAREVRAFLAPRRLPTVRLDGTTLYHSVDRKATLPAEFAALLARCDGTRTAREIAAELGDEAEVFDLLDELVEERAIAWTLEIPTAVTHPDRHLAALLDRITDPAVHERCRAELAELDDRRAAVAAATGASELDAALAAFEARFTSATAADSRRAFGRTYAGRTPLYEDCRRDLEVAIGRPVLDRLARPLALLLASARWFTHEIAARYRRELDAIYGRLGGVSVDFVRFWQDVKPLFPGAAASGSIVGAVRDELRRRWAEILAIGPGERVATRRAAALAGAVERAFAAAGPGWPAARHHSPDVMIAAAGPDAIARGAYVLVVGELHTGFNTVVEPLFVKQHPHPDELIAAREHDVGEIAIAPVWTKAVTRGDYYSLSPRDVDLESGETRSARPRDHVVELVDLVVDRRDGRLEVATRDGRRRFDIIAFLEHHLIAESFSEWSMIEPAAFTPRVAIEDVVVARATWRFAAADLEWPRLDEPAQRFLAARRWARALGIPRWAFVKTAEEVKPVYVDFDSTVFVEILAKQLRGASSASISEMLPAVDEAWVVDAEGARYTSELRVAAVDPARWTPG